MKQFSFFLFLVCSISAFGQVDPDDLTIPDTLLNGQTVLRIAEKMPEFPSGKPGIESLVTKKLSLPESFTGSGSVVVQFIVEKNGSLTDIAIMKSYSPEIDKAVIRLFESMPKWIPGRNNDRKIRIRMAVPIYFNKGIATIYPN